MLTGYLEWWNWRVQVSLAHLVTWRLGPVVHRRKSAHRPPGESGGQWGCTPTDGYIARLLLVECGAGRPKTRQKEKTSQEKTGCLGMFLFRADQKQVRAIKPLIAQQAGTNKLWFVLIKVLQYAWENPVPGVEKGLIATSCTRVKVQCQQETSWERTQKNNLKNEGETHSKIMINTEVLPAMHMGWSGGGEEGSNEQDSLNVKTE